MDMRFGLSDNEIDALRLTFASFPEVEEAIIYGSRARGNYRVSSDIDITLIGKELTYAQLALLDEKIDLLYLPYFVDISLFNSLKDSNLVENIARDGQVFYQR